MKISHDILVPVGQAWLAGELGAISDVQIDDVVAAVTITWDTVTGEWDVDWSGSWSTTPSLFIATDKDRNAIRRGAVVLHCGWADDLYRSAIEIAERDYARTEDELDGHPSLAVRARMRDDPT